MRAAGILQDFQTLVTNVWLEHFVEGEPFQYVKLTLAFVQDFRFTWSTSNPMVHHKIYNIFVELPFADFYAAIKVLSGDLVRRSRRGPSHLWICMLRFAKV